MFKLPWLHSRKRLLSLTFIDTSIFTFLYLRILNSFEIEFFFLFFILSILVVTLVNYILGRYSEIESINKIYTIKDTLSDLSYAVKSNINLIFPSRLINCQLSDIE